MKLNYLSLVGLALSCLYIVISIFTMDLQFDASNQLTRKFQQQYGSVAYKTIFLIITYLGFPVIPCIPLIPLLVLKDKWVPFKICFLFALASYIIGLNKIIYGGPRPWWAEADIKVFMQCSVTDYGRPSGHAFISLYAFLVLFQYYIYEDHSKSFAERVLTHEIEIEDYDYERSSEESTPGTPYLDRQKKVQKVSTLQRPEILEWSTGKTLWLATGIITCILIGISRIYLGAHSFEQILLGWTYGIITYIVTAHWLDGKIDSIILYFLDGRHRSRNLQILIMATTFYLLALTLPIIILAATDSARAASKQFWLANMIKQCGIYTEHNPIDATSLYLCVTIALPFAAVIGLMFAKTNIMITSETLGLTKLIARKLVAALMFTAIAGVFINLPKSGFVMFYLVNLNLSLFFVVMAGYLLLPKVYGWMRLSEGYHLEVTDKSTRLLNDD